MKLNRYLSPGPIILGLASTQLFAQPVLEEVLVTATKREAGMQDVPIALSVMDAEKISEQGIGSLEELAIFMPNVHIAQASGGDQLFIRGIGSGINYGFEQSVGTFIDGVYFGRGEASRSAFLDIERVEVLKGPQSTLFGKNTVAGAINITTAGPTDEFDSAIEGSYVPEFDGWSTTLTLSGPITDSLSGRGVVMREESDGYMDNQFLDQDEVQVEDTVGRITLDWRVTETLDARFKYEHGESDQVGRPNMISIASDFALERYRDVDADFSPDFGYERSIQNIGGVRSSSEFHDSEWNIGTLTLESEIGDYTLRSITGYVGYDFDEYLDLDFSPLALIGRSRQEEFDQFSQEILLSSPLGERFEYLAGLYYQDESIDHDNLTDVILSNAGIGDGSIDATVPKHFEQDTESWSVFTQVTWHITDTLRLISGLRYSEDDKEFEKFQYIADPFTTNGNSVLGGFYDEVLNFGTDHVFDASGALVCEGLDYVCTFDSSFDNQRSEDHWTGDITLQWDASDNSMLYVKVGNGYKAGGFDETNGRGLVDAQEFEDETVEGLELGGKMSLWNGRARFNVAVFANQFDDVQVSTFDGNTGFIVGNAAESETKGVELDGLVAVTDNLTLSAALAYLDAEYKSFTDAACNEELLLDWVAQGGSRENCTQDLSGAPLQFAPEWSGNVALDYFYSLNETLELKLGLDALYSDDMIITAEQDPVLNQNSYWKFNARIQLSNKIDTWSVALLGRNLSDEDTTIWGNHVPLAAQGFSGTYAQFIDAPRSYEIQARYRF